ncbi:MAG: DUF983 domain-containing protein [Saprospiraceae bacterium]
MSKKGNVLKSTFNLTCPRCQTGDLFDTPSFSFQKPFEMPKSCSHCGQNYWPEPGFYYGAMFIGYIFTAWFCIGFIMIIHWVFGVGLIGSFVALLVVLTFFFVYIFRLARSIWIHINIKYDPSKAALVKK